MTKKLPIELKLQRKATRVACEFCHSKHLQCDDTRPCLNCRKRGLQDTCKDSVRRRKSTYRKRSKQSILSEEEPTSKVLGDAPATTAKKTTRQRQAENKRVRLDLIPTEEKGPEDDFSTKDNSNFRSQERHVSSSRSPIMEITQASLTSDPPDQHHNPSLDKSDSEMNLITMSDAVSNTSLTKLLNAATAIKVATPASTDLKTPTLSQINLFSPDLNQKSFCNTPEIAHPTGDSLTNDHSAGFVQTPGQHMFYSSNSYDNALGNHNLEEHSKESTVTPAATNSDMMSTNSSNVKNFESTMANDEYVQLTDLLNTNPPSPSEGFFYDESSIDSSDEDFSSITRRPFIEINMKENTMISSYPNNSTPNSYVYNSKHSSIRNTAKMIPSDLQDTTNYTSPLIMRHVIKTPDDIYLTNIVKAYRYPAAYHALISYLKQRFSQEQLIEIAKCMAKYRPSFISATKNLVENDLIFTERSFQRTLLEYESLIAMSPSPTIIWRRTGEIVALTNEFAVMTGYSKMSLLSKRTFIVELMDDESTIRYFRSFSAFAFGDLNATHLTDCSLRKADEGDYLRCCCVWTIKRDVFDIPMLIVGQFLPVLD